MSEPIRTFHGDEFADPLVLQMLRRDHVVRLHEVVDSRLVMEVHAEGKRVMRAPERVPQECYRRGAPTGYTPPGVEGVAGYAPNQLRHFWDVLPSDFVNARAAEVENLVTRASELAFDLRGVAHRVAAALHQLLPPPTGHERDWIHHHAARGHHELRLTHYPASDDPPEATIFGAHRDFSLFTLFVGGAEPGLQGKIQGEWRDLIAPPGDLLLAAGTLLRFYSGGPEAPDRLQALQHRVRRGNPGDRLSMSLFVEPQHSAVLPNSGGERAGDHILARLRQIRHD